MSYLYVTALRHVRLELIAFSLCHRLHLTPCQISSHDLSCACRIQKRAEPTSSLHMSKEHHGCAGSRNCSLSLLESPNDEVRMQFGVLSRVIQANTVGSLASIHKQAAVAGNQDFFTAVFVGQIKQESLSFKEHLLKQLVNALKNGMTLITTEFAAPAASTMHILNSSALSLVLDLSVNCRTFVRHLHRSKVPEDNVLLGHLLRIVFSGAALLSQLCSTQAQTTFSAVISLVPACVMLHDG